MVSHPALAAQTFLLDIDDSGLQALRYSDSVKLSHHAKYTGQGHLVQKLLTHIQTDTDT